LINVSGVIGDEEFVCHAFRNEIAILVVLALAIERSGFRELSERRARRFLLGAVEHPRLQARRIHPVDRVAAGVGVEVAVAAAEPAGVLWAPAAGLGVVLAGAEVEEVAVPVVEPASKAERLEAGAGI